MQRIHTVTASSTDMAILLGVGFHSAFEISRIPVDKFVEGMSSKLPAETAALYYHKANKITANTSFLYHQLYDLGFGLNPKIGLLKY